MQAPQRLKLRTYFVPIPKGSSKGDKKMETLIVILIVGVAVIYAVKSFIKKYKAGSCRGSDCSCSLNDKSCQDLNEKQ